MKLITVAGPPSSGKTSVILKTVKNLKDSNYRIGVIKFDCLSTYDDELYKKAGVDVKVGLSGGLCPDHFYVSNIEDCVKWGIENEFDYLITESAGLCNRCSPHIRGVLSVCVIDCLSGVNTPKKIGPMLKFADIVVITKGDIVSQAEREVFSFHVKQSNPNTRILFVNGITGQGAFQLGMNFKNADGVEGFDGKKLRFTMPSAICSYCLGETKIGAHFQMGSVKKMKF
ncbi:GTP-binding protein [Clostridium tyrobutyricum]|uniref:GTP-binding protein n=1 Tax=Clostridium tyrobutyricum TaxID=1519 RepID=UPI0005801B69|nr:GTP-binding protein [Clostridium tyrobutyricum]